MSRADDPASIAREVLAALDGATQIAPFSRRDGGLGKEKAYAAAHELRALRLARGEKPVGRKIGFTNRGIWAEYGVYAPIWGDMYDTTVVEVGGDRLRISHLPEPRIEPEIVLGLERDLQPGMALADIEASIAWVAHGFEIVQSIFPGWSFGVADCIADGGLHGALALGPKRPLAQHDRTDLNAKLCALTLDLHRNDVLVDAGTGANALDGPVEALRHLVQVLAADPLNPPLRAGEIVTTGTLTRAFPVSAGERWSTTLSGYPLAGIAVELS